MDTHAPFSLLAPAKINLSLHICGRRDDGYHALESLVAFADIGDRLTFEKADRSSLDVDGGFAPDLVRQSSGDNLIEMAHKRLENALGVTLNCRITVHKNLPIAAGLGGGSADAAAALRGLNRFFALDVPHIVLSKLAQELGADIPVCLSPRPAWMRGIGHDVTRLPDLPEADIVLVNPRVDLPTATVFESLSAAPQVAPPQPIPQQFSDLAALTAFIASQGNGLYETATAHVPDIEDCLSHLRANGAAYAAMSGSGASCFALVEAGAGADVATAYQAHRPTDWVAAGRLIGARDTEIDEA